MQEPAMTDTIIVSNRLRRRMWGLDLDSWNNVLLLFLAIAALAAAIVGFSTYATIQLAKQEAADSKREYETYKLTVEGQVADAKREGIKAGEAAGNATLRAAELEHQTARLQADNLALQTVLLPRSAGSIGIDQRPPAETWFSGLQHWAGTKLLIQVIPGDAEAQNLANEIAIIVSQFGWRPEFIDQKRSGVSLNLREGLEVMSPSSYKAWDPKDEAQATFRKLGEAARALATALTNARLGVGPYPVSGVRGLSMTVDLPPDSPAAKTSPFRNFSPPLDGVYLQIGARPVAATLQWIRQGRPDEFGIVHPQAQPTEKDK